MNRLRYFWVLLALSLSNGLWPALLAAAPRWNDVLKQPAAWYASAEARAVADNVLLYQHATGGWPKNRDMTVPPPVQAETKETADPTIDNGATTTQLHLLARVQSAQPAPVLRAAFERGFDYLLAAQYENGGWPQFFPLRKGYYSHITYNDNAMVNVLTLLRDAATGQEPFAFVDEVRRARAAAAVEKGIACILRTQVRQEGKLTAWCAQHDEHTLAPAWARAFEPPSLSGMESAGLLKFLLGEPQPSPEIIAAVEGAVAWLTAVRISGLRVESSVGADGKRERLAVADPAAPPVWARFYELGTNRPIFLGRDKIVRYDHNEIERERRAGYAYLGEWPAQLLARDYPRWRAKHNLP